MTRIFVDTDELESLSDQFGHDADELGAINLDLVRGWSRTAPPPPELMGIEMTSAGLQLRLRRLAAEFQICSALLRREAEMVSGEQTVRWSAHGLGNWFSTEWSGLLGGAGFLSHEMDIGQQYGGDILLGLRSSPGAGLLSMVFNAKTTADDWTRAYTTRSPSKILTVGMDVGLMGAGIVTTADGIVVLLGGAAVVAPEVVLGLAAVGVVVGLYRLGVDHHIWPDFVSHAVDAEWTADCRAWKATVHEISKEAPRVVNDVGRSVHAAGRGVERVAHLFK
jgi:hypothetical protein